MATYKHLFLISVFTAFFSNELKADLPIRLPNKGDFCGQREKYAPDGIIQKLGQRYYRVCNPILKHDWGNIQNLRINPKYIQNLFSEYSTTALLARDRPSYIRDYQNSTRFQQPSRGIRKFGRYTYIANEENRLRGKNRRPVRGTYTPKSEYVVSGEMVPHFFTCLSEAQSKKPGYSCWLVVPYHDISIQLSFFFLNSLAGPMPEKDIPNFAGDLVRILEQIDVTDNLDQWRKKLPISYR